ncbi:TRAP transporter small permease [Lampropedia puyangensis]|uniref:TRAP transporter small permease protein n=1 Tax=Lampropedia puyangensis TaxID=1330072 RepID=A0A4S8FA36_9BURK|nr:TRAP transporter small permease [Lampropedia puyangensis]THU03695.1 TRAP transporter small permease [Lampropedia puyangensis]
MTTSVSLLARLYGWANQISRYAVWFGGAITIASVLLVTFDVLVRKFFGFNLGGADELSSYAFAVSTTWAFAFASLQRANVRVDVLYQYLPVRLSALVDWISLVGLGIFMAFLTFYAKDMVLASFTQGSTANSIMATPLWIPQGLWLIGLLWMCIVLALMLIRASVALVTGDIRTLKEVCGVRSAQEEAEEEAANGERMVKGNS